MRFLLENILTFILTTFLILPFVQPAFSAEDQEKPEGRKPLVVMQQAAIKGRVYIIGEKEAEELAASNIKVEIRDIETDERLYKTKADKEGRYTLPNLETGLYNIIVGRLVFKLQVEPPEVVGGKEKLIPKTILIFIPEAMK